VECLLALEKWDRAADMLTEMIRAIPDQWAYIQQYISCQLKRCKIKRREELAGRSGSDEEVKSDDSEDGKLPVAADPLPGESGDVWNDLK
jgi:hypothetical protein